MYRITIIELFNIGREDLKPIKLGIETMTVVALCISVPRNSFNQARYIII